MKYQKERIASTTKVSEQYLKDISVELGREEDDFLKQLITVRVTASTESRLIADKKELVYHAPRPKFLDWLFRRHKRVVFELTVKDLKLIDKNENDLRIYETYLKQ